MHTLHAPTQIRNPQPAQLGLPGLHPCDVSEDTLDLLDELGVPFTVGPVARSLGVGRGWYAVPRDLAEAARALGRHAARLLELIIESAQHAGVALKEWRWMGSSRTFWQHRQRTRHKIDRQLGRDLLGRAWQALARVGILVTGGRGYRDLRQRWTLCLDQLPRKTHRQAQAMKLAGRRSRVPERADPARQLRLDRCESATRWLRELPDFRHHIPEIELAMMMDHDPRGEEAMATNQDQQKPAEPPHPAESGWEPSAPQEFRDPFGQGEPDPAPPPKLDPDPEPEPDPDPPVAPGRTPEDRKWRHRFRGFHERAEQEWGPQAAYQLLLGSSSWLHELRLASEGAGDQTWQEALDCCFRRKEPPRSPGPYLARVVYELALKQCKIDAQAMNIRSLNSTPADQARRGQAASAAASLLGGLPTGQKKCNPFAANGQAQERLHQASEEQEGDAGPQTPQHGDPGMCGEGPQTVSEVGSGPPGTGLELGGPGREDPVLAPVPNGPDRAGGDQ